MTTDLSRRLFLSAAATGASIATSGLIGAAASAAADAPSKPDYLYGPDPADAHLIFNENPFGPSPSAIRALSQASVRAAYYQGKSIEYLMSMIAERHGVKPEQVLISNGSYESLTATAMAYADKGKVLGPDLFWDSTTMWAVKHGMTEIVRVPMLEGLEVDLDGIKAAVNDEIGLVQIVNPNNPTGRLINPRKLKKFCKEVSKTHTVLVDEAYMEITDDPEGNSMMDLVREGRNVIVSRTFSKIYGMAGLRVGYLLGEEETIAKIRSYLVSSPNVAGISAAIDSYNDHGFLAYSKSKIVEAREMITDATKSIGLNPLPSQTSFVFVDVKMPANDFQAKMKEKRVLIRGAYGEYKQYSRVSAGYLEDVQRYVDALPYAVEA